MTTMTSLLSFVLLQAEAAPATAKGGNFSFLIMMLLIFVVMYFFMIRPQQKKQKEIAKFREAIKKGDKLVTVGGIYGVVADVKEQYVILSIDENVKIRVDKQCVVKDSSDIQTQQ